MCGIVALITNGDVRSYVPGVTSAVESMRHRGPDDVNVSTCRGAVLAHSRLSIIDLDSGTQPMQVADGRYVITYNGEIFNYREIRQELQNLRYSFKTNSDTEVVLNAYREYGRNCLDHFRGMFAFVIYDNETGEAFLARDRYGIKPLYYSVVDGTLLVSSEIRPMYKIGLLSFELEERHINEYVIFGYVAGSETLHKRVYELEAGHYGMWRKGDFVKRRYWYPCEGQNEGLDICEDEAIEKLDDLLRDSVKLWMTADVEVGSLLSGGVDSPTVSVIASQVNPKIRTFTAVFPDDDAINERRHAESVIKRINNSCAKIITFEDSFIADNLYHLVSHLDDPIMDPNNYTLMAILEAVRSETDLKVLLCGEGADEVFGGYGRHREIAEQYAEDGNIERLAFAYNVVALPRLELFSDSTSIRNDYRFRCADKLRSTTPVNKILELDQLTFLGTRLQSQDRLGMMYSIEVRTPFLEHELTSFVNSLPAGLKIREGYHKWILRKVAVRYIDSEVAWERRKVGLPIPYSRLLHDGVLRDVFIECIHSDSHIASFYDVEGMHRLLAMHRPEVHGSDHSNTLWRLLALELWLRSII